MYLPTKRIHKRGSDHLQIQQQYAQSKSAGTERSPGQEMCRWTCMTSNFFSVKQPVPQYILRNIARHNFSTCCSNIAQKIYLTILILKVSVAHRTDILDRTGSKSMDAWPIWLILQLLGWGKPIWLILLQLLGWGKRRLTMLTIWLFNISIFILCIFLISALVPPIN
jgi:hypothetical protein